MNKKYGGLGETASPPAKGMACRDAEAGVRPDLTQTFKPEDDTMTINTMTTGTVKTTTGSSTKIAKLFCGLLAAGTIAMTVMPQDAEAGWRGRRNWAIGAGVIGGLAVGGLLASGAYGHGGYYAAPVYSGPDCYFVKQRRETWDGYVVVRRVRVCD
jgi:hypothetical protein